MAFAQTFSTQQCTSPLLFPIFDRQLKHASAAKKSDMNKLHSW